jgi:CDP-diacylglycerol---serine O-phosphatidyltransferase
MNLLRHLPNTLTSGNLLCGCLGLVSMFGNYPVEPAYFIWAACVFDFFDGFTARMLKVSSSIGKELDSLADMVSFGVLPAITMYRWIDSSSGPGWLAYLALLIAVFSALRLAKFNVDTRQTDSFIGVPTPANALFLTSLVFLPDPFRTMVFTPVVLATITIVFSFMLIAPMELFALKFKDFSWNNNKLRFTFLAIAVFLMVIIKAGALPFIILSYILISLLSNILNGKENN